MLVASCSKEDTNDQLPDQGMEQTISLSAFETYLNTDISKEMIHGDDVITIVDCENNTVNQFTDIDVFKKWSYSNTSLKSTNGVSLYESYEFLNEIAQLAEDLGITDSYEYGDAVPVEIQKKLSEIQNSNNYAQKGALNLTMLYDNIDYHDQLGLYPTQFVPALADAHRNKTESLQLVGPNGTWYCDRTWFRGDKIYFITLTHYWLPNLLGFNNKIESIFAII